MSNTESKAFSPRRRSARLLALLATISALLAVAASGAQASGGFEITKFDGEVTRDAAGDPATQAGSHPYQAETEIEFAKGANPFVPAANFKDLQTLLPPGLVGNPNATPKCTMAAFQVVVDPLTLGECPNDTAVGYADVSSLIPYGGHIKAALYNLTAGPGEPARFGFHILTASIYLDMSVRTGGDYGLTINVSNSSQALPVTGTRLVFWGVPFDSSHDKSRGSCMSIFGPSGAECKVSGPHVPFLTNPTSCEGPVTTTLRANSWQGEPGQWVESSFLSHNAAKELAEPTGCPEVPFEPSFEVKATPGSAAAPSSLAVDIKVPQSEGPEQLASADLKKAAVTLPAGVTVNAAAANGLLACTAAQIQIGNADPAACPDGSRIGAAEIVSPLLTKPLQGSVFLAKQGENPSGSLLGAYLVAEAEGVLLKLPGKIDADPASGQVTATFDDNPQLPFSELELNFFGGPGGVLAAPSSCGTYTASAQFTPWSGTAPVSERSSFRVSSGPEGGACPGGGLATKLSAGTVNPSGGRYSPFVLELSREDGSEAIAGIDAKLPAGLLAKLAGVPYCPDATLAAIPTAAGSGAAQLAAPSCPAASQVGSVAVAAGVGPSPTAVKTGRAYLAGPYRGAPLSLALVVPALAGPFDLGNVVDRVALRVNPETAQVEAVSDPIPTLLSGIPLNLRRIQVRLDREGFTVNPTSCDPTAVAATVAGASGGSAAVSDRFQASSCASLDLSPKLTLSLTGSTRRAGHPKLRAVLEAKPGQANLRRVSVALPRSELLAQSHIRTVCTRVQFAAGTCPAGSVYGYAKAYSPLLDKPLEGPVYLRSSDNPLPDLVAALHGQIEIDLAGRIDSVHGGIRDTFEAIPDAPITRFELSMKGGAKGLLENSRDLCRAGAGRATVQTDGHNGKTANQRPALRAGCGNNG
jgi:hypothetical protein